MPLLSTKQSKAITLATAVLSFAITVLIGLWLRGGGTDEEKGVAQDDEHEGFRNERGSVRHGADTGAPTGSGHFKTERTGSKAEIMRGPAFQLYHDTGMLNPRILDLAGVPVGKRAGLQEGIERRWSEFSRDFESRAELIEAGDGEGNLGTYRIAGSAAIADAFRKTLEDEISSFAGRGGAEILIKYLDQEGHFAGLGRYNVEMKLYKTDSMGESVRAVQYEVTEPRSGRRLAEGGTSDPLGYWRRFGNAFSGEE